MSAEDSFEELIRRLRAGDEDAARELWQRYSERLIRLAHKKLQGGRGPDLDGEDAVNSAFRTFYRRAEKGEFPNLHDSDNLWRLLMVITIRKALKQLKREKAEKRGEGKIRGDSIFPDGFAQVLGKEPTPEMAAMAAEECRRLLDRLGDAQLQLLAQRKMEGFTNEEIAVELDCAVRTVERKLDRIRGIWKKEIER